MILRKPYAFLIKYFKLIHLFISVLIVFLISKTNNIKNFFIDYINDDIFEFNASSYVNFFVYLALIVLIGLAVAILVLMRKKDKPVLFYVFTIIGYSTLFVGFAYTGSIINSLEFNYLDRQTIGLARDVTRFMLIGQWIFLIPYVIRTLGFDIKKFDFKKDMQELDIAEEDNEEFELLSPVNMDKVAQVGRRRVRELKYYYLENRLLILIILGIVAVIGGVTLFKKIDFSSLKRYDEKEIINLENFYTLMIEDSYLTTKSDAGKRVAVNDTFYLIVKFTVNSMYNGTFNLETNKFIVDIGDKQFLAERRYYDYFKSYGIGYKKQSFKLNDNKTYILVYNIPNKYKNKKMKLEYNYRYDYGSGEAKMIKKIVKLEPENMD